jgi:hypothetical protein
MKKQIVVAQPRLAAQLDFFLAAGGAALPPQTLANIKKNKVYFKNNIQC